MVLKVLRKSFLSEEIGICEVEEEKYSERSFYPYSLVNQQRQGGEANQPVLECGEDDPTLDISLFKAWKSGIYHRCESTINIFGIGHERSFFNR